MNNVWQFCSNGEALMEQQMVSDSFSPAVRPLLDIKFAAFACLSNIRLYLGFSWEISSLHPSLFLSYI